MRELLILAVHLLVTVAKLLRRGGGRAVAAESLLLKHQLLISNRSRKRAPNSDHARSLCARTDRAVRKPASDCQAWRTRQAGDTIQVPPCLGESQIPPAILLFAASLQTRTQRPVRGTDRGHRGDEAAQSALRLHANRPADLPRLRRATRQRW